MRYSGFHLILLSVLILGFSCPVGAQSWDFIKEKDGIKIYTHKEPGKALKSYKGVTDIKAPAEKVFALIEDVNHTEWWDKNFSQIRVLLYEKYKRAQYYLVYHLPWPVENRDLCVNVIVTYDSLTGAGTISAGPLPGVVPERHDLVRIKEYRQTWTVTPAGRESAHVELVGYIDPAGNIPDWISNMLIVDSPIEVISGVRQRVEKK
jgi:hypothetical protein